MKTLTNHFQTFREGIIGKDEIIQTPYGTKRMLYADWTASGRLYAPIEDIILHQFGPYVANTHTESNITGTLMTKAYHEAKHIIKDHVGANKDDVLLFSGTGMTGAMCKFQRMIGVVVHERLKKKSQLPENERPVVFITHMEHHSNQTTWSETLVDVVVVPPNERGEVCPEQLRCLLEQYKDRPLKIGSFTACSNVTGIKTPYYELARIMHEYKGICLVDFSASAPYVAINMHPEDPAEQLDGIFFSPHKFLGGPGTTGVVVFSKELYKNSIPDHPGGGTVHWTNPWGDKSYIENIEEREDGGTPGFLQAIRTSLAIKLKEKMGIGEIAERETALMSILVQGLQQTKGITLLENGKWDRLPILSFYAEGIHHNLFVKLLNDVHGVQVRGGCSCAGTYGHFLLGIEKDQSKSITDEVDKKNYFVKPGWVRVSLHPTLTEEEIQYLVYSIKDVVENIHRYRQDYQYNDKTNEFTHRLDKGVDVSHWFNL